MITTEELQTLLTKFFKKEGLESHGCQTFYTPEEWKERGESYCCNSKLVVVYDGSDVRRAMSLDGEDYKLNERMQNMLRAVGCYYEEGTHWYGGVYPI